MGFLVTLDGPAAAGKSTTARRLAARLGYLYLDTGALYRALALRVLREHVDPEDAEAVAACARAARLDLAGPADGLRVRLDGEDVTEEIRAPAVSELASRIAVYPAVRAGLIEAQRSLVERGPLVAEGRDLGTVVFPDATVKIYLDADLDTRAHRRYRELAATGIGVPLDEVRSDLQRRDERDRHRQESPLRPAPDAVVLDTSRMNIEEQVGEVFSIVLRRGGKPLAGAAEAV